MEEETKHIFGKKENCIFTEEYHNEIDQHYEMIMGNTEKVAVHHFVYACLQKAVSRVAPVKINLELQEENKKLKEALKTIQEESNSNGQSATNLQLQMEVLNARIDELEKENESLKNNSVNEKAVILEFDNNDKLHFFKSCLEIFKRDKICTTPGEMFLYIILALKKFNKNYFEFDDKDIAYLKTVFDKKEVAEDE